MFAFKLQTVYYLKLGLCIRKFRQRKSSTYNLSIVYALIILLCEREFGGLPAYNSMFAI